MRKKIITLLSFTILCTLTVAAQNEAAKIDSLQQRIAKLEKRSVTWDKIKQHFNIHIINPLFRNLDLFFASASDIGKSPSPLFRQASQARIPEDPTFRDE